MRSPSRHQRSYNTLGHQLHVLGITFNPRNGGKMKVDGNGQGKILSQDEVRRLFSEGFLSPRDRSIENINCFRHDVAHLVPWEF
ncbi:hypothetical protein [Nostoc sp. ATCC 53789]|uniref:hypothetical protein n=1 Tax=Nostoc sp. ATCC 53789 TaxID=76335 RepID=UPI0011BD4BA1|nr:hypothetical protein [Nostoc sp. ATCC 53789]QHG21054.1 hypothetical protein GJB62_34950 [Nostoc sp. ATCC 53789]